MQHIILILIITLFWVGQTQILSSGDVSVSTHSIKKQPVSIENLLKVSNSDEVQFQDCTGPHDETFDIDNDYSYSEPAKISKNSDIVVFLEGVMNADEHVDGLHVDVYWNGNLFHSEDHKLDDDVEEQEPYEVQFKWFVPGFAPSGGYIVDLIVKAQGQELGCERATFIL